MPPQDPELAAWFRLNLQPHEAMLRAWLRSRFPQAPDLDDVVQEAFARVLAAPVQQRRQPSGVGPLEKGRARRRGSGIPFRSMRKLPLFATALTLALLPPAFAAEPKSKNAGEAKTAKTTRVRYADAVAATVKPTEIVTYKRVGDRELKLHVFKPEGWKASDKRPAFVTIHGGGWTGGDPTRMYAFASYWASRGMVAISVQYRLYKPGSDVSVFDCVADGRSAIRYVRAHAAELGIDPNRIVANGGSAGGHVVVATALFSKFDTPGEDQRVSAVPNALVLFFPVIDTSKEGYGQAKIGERWKELSPAHNVRPGLPPTLTFHGTGDTTTPFKGAELFHAQMLKAGNRSQLDVNDGGAHGYLMTTEALFNDTNTKTEDFLRKVGMFPAK